MALELERYVSWDMQTWEHLYANIHLLGTC